MKCSICLEPIINLKTLECGHSGWKACLNKWLSLKGNCPWCRQKFASVEYYHDDFLDLSFINHQSTMSNLIVTSMVIIAVPLIIINSMAGFVINKIVDLF